MTVSPPSHRIALRSRRTVTGDEEGQLDVPVRHNVSQLLHAVGSLIVIYKAKEISKGNYNYIINSSDMYIYTIPGLV